MSTGRGAAKADGGGSGGEAGGPVESQAIDGARDGANDGTQGAAHDETPGAVAKALRLVATPAGVSTLVAIAAGVTLYLLQGKATGILATGFGFFVAWVVSNILMGLPPPTDPRRGDWK